MIASYQPDARDRLRGALGAALLVALLVWGLLLGLAMRDQTRLTDTLQLFTPLALPPPPVERTRRQPTRHHRREGAASPPNLRSQATDIVAPVTPLPVPPRVVTAPVANTGLKPTQGAAEVAGPGTGAGGTGTGSGGEGDGDGDGGETAPRLRSGRIRDSDYPHAAGTAGYGGVVGVRYLVGVDGHVGECRITRSSGSQLLDQTTCRLIQQRFRFRPSLDVANHAVPAWIVESHEWSIHDEPPDPDAAAPPPPPRRRFGIF